MGITLKVGGTYVVRDGGTARVVAMVRATGSYVAVVSSPWLKGEREMYYGRGGETRGGLTALDLVSEIYDGLASQFIRLWNCGLIAISSANGRGVDVLRHYADGARLEATYPTLREALRCAR